MKNYTSVWAVAIVRENFLFFFHLGFEFTAHVKNGKNGIRFWKHKSSVYYVLLKLWEQSSYLKLKCHVIYEVNGR